MSEQNGKPENIELWIMQGIDISSREIMIDEVIDEVSVGRAIRALKKMVVEYPERPIYIHINTYGGSVYDGLALYDAIQAVPCVVVTYAHGKCMSMGLIIYLAGDIRVASNNATFMAHAVSGETYGKEFEQGVDYKETKRLNDTNLNILATRTKKTKAWWAKRIKHEDYYMDLEEARKLGVTSED